MLVNMFNNMFNNGLKNLVVLANFCDSYPLYNVSLLLSDHKL